MLDGRDTHVDEPSPGRKSELHWDRPAPTKGRPPFREAMPERFNRAKVWGFMSALPEVPVAWHPAETSRCTPCAPDRTSGSHATTYPYATVVPNVLDERNRPLLLVSALAEHTKNLLAAPRVSLSLVELGATNVQTAAHMTLLGDAEWFEPDELLKARYLRYLPEAGQYLELDSMFFRIYPKRTRFIAGVGKMGWLEAEEWSAVPSLTPARECTLVEIAQQAARTGIRILGVDCYGIDYEVDGFRDRQAFEGHDAQVDIDDGFVETVASQLS